MNNLVELMQGSEAWYSHRMTHLNASEASAMLGISPYKTRADLIREKATGIVPEVDAATQARFDRGHAIEAAARPSAEAVIDDSLFPSVYADTVNGLPLSASLDGITMDGETAWECKTLNADLAEWIPQGHIPPAYHPQMEQGLLLSGATRCLFTASDGTEENTYHAWYESDPELRKLILAGWKQFAEDVANYQHVETAQKPAGATVESMPVPFVQIEGRVVAPNMGEFKAAAQAFLDRLPKTLTTDQDFADAEKAAKACKEAEDRLSAIKDAAQAQAISIDEVFRAIDTIKAQVRDARLALEKQVKTEKETRKAQIANEYRDRLLDHLRKLDERIGGKWMPRADTLPLLRDAVYGLKTLDSMRNKLDGWLANSKIQADEIADRIEANLRCLSDLDRQLFPDFAQVCMKDKDDFANLLNARASERAKREEAIKEAERKRIEEDQRWNGTVTYTCEKPDTSHLRQNGGGQQTVRADARVMPATEDVPSTPPDNGKRLKLGELKAILAPVSIDSDGLAQLGIMPVGHEKAAKLYRECDIRAVCMAIIGHMQSVMERSHHERH